MKIVLKFKSYCRNDGDGHIEVIHYIRCSNCGYEFETPQRIVHMYFPDACFRCNERNLEFAVQIDYVV